MNISEYNAFGPWIYEISDKYPVPLIFRDYVKDLTSHLMLIKIPVEAERRNLKPGMNMYDYVIGLYENHIHVYKNVSNAVAETVISYKDVLAVEHSINLLRSELKIYTGSELFSIVYNTSSEPVIHKLIKIIREKTTENTGPNESDNYETSSGNFCFFFKSILRLMEHRESGFKVIGSQEETDIKFLKRTLLKNIIEKLLKPYLPGSLHVINPKELIIVSRGEDNFYRRYANHGYSYIYLPISNILEIRKMKSEIFNEVNDYKIRLRGHEFTIPVHSKNKDLGYLDKLKS